VTAAEAEAKLRAWRGLFNGCGVKVGAMFYAECSAKTGQGVKSAFERLVREVRAQRLLEEKELQRRNARLRGGAGVGWGMFSCCT
jgi:hypothetical protein